MDALTWWDGWGPAFVLTCLIEVPVYLVMFDLFGLVGAPRIDRNATGPAPTGPAPTGSAPTGPAPTGPGPASWGSALSWPRAVLLALVLNAITHPVFWASALHVDSTVGLVLAELVVTLTEGLIIWAVVRRRPLACLACALVANATSAVLGTAISATVISLVS